MKTAHSIGRTGFARVKGEHLQAVNDASFSKMRSWLSIVAYRLFR